MRISRNPMELYAAIAQFAADPQGKKIMDEVLRRMFTSDPMPFVGSREIICRVEDERGPNIDITYSYTFTVTEVKDAEDSPVGQAPVGED